VVVPTQPPGAAHAAPPGATPQNLDYCLAQCLEIMPPGQNGNASFGDILLNKALGIRPKHSDDQIAKYERLVWNYQNVTNDGLQDYYNPSSFGLPAGGVESTVSPRSDVTIYREKATGIPHVRGTTREGTMFGAGYASAGDRLFLMDLLRHLGRGELTSFAGGSPANRQFEQDQFDVAPYTEDDLQRQFDQGDELYGEPGVRLQRDVLAYVAGVNRYIADIVAGRNILPGEYTAIGRSAVETWKVTDVVATASLVGGLFGNGGGGEVRSALALIAAKAKYGAQLGTEVWKAFRSADDPEAPVTLHNGEEFPYGQSPVDAPGRVMPDPSTLVAQPLVTEPTDSGMARVNPVVPAKRAMSNALIVSGSHSVSGHPLAVFGPQSGYFSPQLLMEIDLQGPGISAHGAAFAGVSMFVLLGRGQDYSWGATSAGQDIADTFTPELCEPDGRPATLDSMHYMFRGQCLPIEVIRKRNDWKPTLADGTPAGGYTLVKQRTKLGLVSHRGRLDGKPVLFTVLRSTYMHEGDSGIGFSMFNDPSVVRSARDFQRAAEHVGYAFNWLYVDADDTAYINTGANPVRAPGADPNFPNRAEPAYEWRNWNPDTNMADYVPFEQRPQSLNQDWYANWNSKQARGHWAADDQYGYGPVYRVKPLEDRLRAGTSGGRKMTKAQLVAAAMDAATVDLRGDTVLPLALRVIGTAPTGDAALDAALAKLRGWAGSGAHRIAPSAQGPYTDTEAIKLLDAWWPRWVKAEFSGLGPELYSALTNIMSTDQPAGHRGSAYQEGWYGYAHKDLRAILGEPVQDGFPRTFCGGGNQPACRSMLLDTLRQAMAAPATEVYPADAFCPAGDQYCHDQIVQQPLGGIAHNRVHWMNRPTYQQVMEFPARRGQDIANLALGRPVSASSTQFGYPAANAVDGDISTRWASDWKPSESITVDLGSVRPVGRAVLDWEAAYASEFSIQLSSDGASWRTATTVTGKGGRNVVSFTPAQARYVRMLGTTRGTGYGYSLWEFAIYAQ
jgi:acyl-homoserine lactone acylase PvdQ